MKKRADGPPATEEVHGPLAPCQPQWTVDAISIRARPAEAEDRAIPGHGEGDLLSGAKNSHIAALVERHSRLVMLIKVPDTKTRRWSGRH